MVGDVVHNARSALDQAAWLLACRSNPVDELWDPKIAWKIAFPVTHDPGRFKTHKVIPFLADDAVAVLEALQPYEGGDTPECIGWLDRLWNIDKHRVIHSSTLLVDVALVKFRTGAYNTKRDLFEHPPVITWSDPPDRVKDGAEIARVRFHEGLGPPYTKVEVTGQPTLDVAFGGGDFMLSVDALGGLLVATTRALKSIEDLPEAAS
ncbi:MAG TPA: hypothetical protein VFS54_04225 [Solirubrobacterales bacterium]|nr:hypothetical protein [Solirubrobacterales bacterium]